MSEDLRKYSYTCDEDKHKDYCCKKDEKHNEDKYDKYDKKKDVDCCCDIKTLRCILKIFEDRDVLVVITTKTDQLRGYISKVTEDVVYLSETFEGTNAYFVPLCTIVRFFVDLTNASGFSEEIRYKVRKEIECLIHSTCNLNPCCCTDGIANAINNIKKCNLVEPICFNLDTTFEFDVPYVNCFELREIIKANADIVFAIKDDEFYIYPTCGIDYISLSTVNGG